MPSVFQWTLGKGTIKSDRWSLFAECFSSDTRQTLETLPSVLFLTPGKVEKICRVFSVVHSAKSTSPFHPVKIFLPRVYFCRVFTDTRQTVCRVPDKKHSANYCLPTNQCRVLYAECNTRQSICRVFLGVCRVPLTLGKSTVSRSAPVEKLAVLPVLNPLQS